MRRFYSPLGSSGATPTDLLSEPAMPVSLPSDLGDAFAISWAATRSDVFLASGLAETMRLLVDGRPHAGGNTMRLVLTRQSQVAELI